MRPEPQRADGGAHGVRLREDLVGEGRGASGRQEELAALIEYLRPGDRLVVTKLDRAGRTVRGLIDTVQEVESRGAAFVCLGDSIDTATPHGRLFFTMIAAMAEFERAVAVRAAREGLPLGEGLRRSAARIPATTLQQR